MNVNITNEVTETMVIESDNAKVVVTNRKITLINAYRTTPPTKSFTASVKRSKTRS